MKEQIQKITDYIDLLNAEQKPDEDETTATTEEMKELYRTIRIVRSLREPAMPDSAFPAKLALTVADRVHRKRAAAWRRGWMIGTACASILVVLLLALVSPVGRMNAVSAMEQAYRGIGAYHGTLEVTSTDANGQSTKQAVWDVWADKDGRYAVQGLAGSNAQLVTVNNGERKWQVQPNENAVHLFPAVPDPYRFQFELGNEIQEARQAAEVKEVGADSVAGRPVTVLEVTPKGGLPYRLWVDKETNLPMQKQTAMQHAIQYTITYTRMEFSDVLPAQLLAYQLPAGYQEVNAYPEQMVSDLQEAQSIAGFALQWPVDAPTVPPGYTQQRLTALPEQQLIKRYYTVPGGGNDRIVVTQGPAAGESKPASDAVLGTLNGNVAEIRITVAGQPASIRWRQDGAETTLTGDADWQELVAFARVLTNDALQLPPPNESSTQPQVKVPYELSIEKADQQNADAGSSPWKLDPVFVAQVFVSLQLSPDGISGDFPVREEELEAASNNGTRAVIAVHNANSPSKRVYLERVVRQDETGIWTVVGYDPAASK